MKDKMIFVLGAACGIVLAAGCGPKQPQAPVTSYFDSSFFAAAQDRVALCRQLLFEPEGLELEDAAFVFSGQFRTERMDDPVAALFFGRLTLSPASAAALKARLRPAPAPEYAAPPSAPEWWPKKDQFEALQFFTASDVLKEYSTAFMAFEADGKTVLVMAKNP